jgi:hypothetical protein
VEREPLVDQLSVGGHRFAVAGQHEVEVHRLRRAERLDVGDERLRALCLPVARARDERVRGDVLEQVVGRQQHPPLGVVEDGVADAVPGPVVDGERAVAQLDGVAVAQDAGDLGRRAPGPEGGRHRAQRLDDVLGEPVAEHHRAREVVLEYRLLGVVLDQRHRRVERRHVGARVAGDDRDEAEVVHVVVGEDHQLDVLDRAAVAGERRLERVERAAGVGAGVDQRQRVVVDQVAVDAPDGERRRDRQPVDPLSRGGRVRVVRHERISASTSSRFSSMWARDESDSRFSRSSGSVFDGRTLKCQSS